MGTVQITLNGQTFEMERLSPARARKLGRLMKRMGKQITRDSKEFKPSQRNADRLAREIRVACIEALHFYAPHRLTRAFLQTCDDAEMGYAIDKLAQLNTTTR